MEARSRKDILKMVHGKDKRKKARDETRQEKPKQVPLTDSQMMVKAIEALLERIRAVEKNNGVGSAKLIAVMMEGLKGIQKHANITVTVPKPEKKKTVSELKVTGRDGKGDIDTVKIVSEEQ